MPDEQVGVKITTTADVRGAEKVTQSLKGATDATEKFGRANSKLASALRSVVGNIPVLNQLAGALANPYLFAAAAVGAFVLAVQKWLDKQRAIEQAALDVSTAIDSVNAAIRNQGTDSKETTKQLEDYLEQIRAIEAESSSIDTKSSKEQKDAARKMRVANKVDTENTRGMEASVDMAVAQGKMTPEEGRARKRQLRSALGQRTAGREEALISEQAKIAAAAAEAHERTAQAAAAALPGARSAAGAASLRAGTATLGRGELKKQAAAEIALVDKAIQDAQKDAAGPGFMASILGERFWGGITGNRVQTPEQKQQTIKRLEEYRESLVRFGADQDSAIAGAQGRAASASGVVSGLQKEVLTHRRGSLSETSKAAEFRSALGETRTGNRAAAAADALVEQSEIVIAQQEAIDAAAERIAKTVVDALNRVDIKIKNANGK